MAKIDCQSFLGIPRIAVNGNREELALIRDLLSAALTAGDGARVEAERYVDGLSAEDRALRELGAVAVNAMAKTNGDVPRPYRGPSRLRVEVRLEDLRG